MSSAPILVHGATGFTGRLVCAALSRRGIPFAAGGRDPAKLAALAERHRCETVRIDLGVADTVVAAIRGRAAVLACAGPFIEVGEPVLATCAREGVSYADTTGEQRFVADMAARYRATAEARGACIAPSFAYEIAPADWAADVAAKALGVVPERITIAYLLAAARGGYGTGTSRGTKRSALRMMREPSPLQYVDGALVVEPVAEKRTRVFTDGGRAIDAVSFPSPEAVLVPRHTKARTVRTFMAVGAASATAIHALRGAIPVTGRVLGSLLDDLVARTPEGPGEAEREASFEVVAIAEGEGGRRAVARAIGRDPYGLTAEIQALFALRAIGGELGARGVVAPSEAVPAEDAFAALENAGLRCTAH